MTGDDVRALITGCAGFIGSHLVDSLLVSGAEVIGIDCFTENYDRMQKLENLSLARQSERFQLLELNIVEDVLTDCVEDAGVIFHLAAEPGVRLSWGRHFEDYVRNNVLGTQRLLEAVKTSPDKRFVFASSSSVYGEAERFPTPESAPPKPFSPYGVTKLAAENLVRLYAQNYGLDAISLRYFSVYGPRQRPDMAFYKFFRAAIDRRPLTLFGDGSQSRDFTFVSDAVDATIKAGQSPSAGEVYNVGGGSQIRLSDAIAVIGGLVGVVPEIRSTVPERGDVHATGASIALARQELGYEPLVSLDEGLKAQFDWMHDPVRSPKHTYEV